MTARDQTGDDRPGRRRLESLPPLLMLLSGNETRLGVLLAVGAGVDRVTAIAEQLQVARCDVSKHLAKLYRAGLIGPRPEEPFAYSLAENVLVTSDERGVEIVVLADGMQMRLSFTTRSV